MFREPLSRSLDRYLDAVRAALGTPESVEESEARLRALGTMLGTVPSGPVRQRALVLAAPLATDLRGRVGPLEEGILEDRPDKDAKAQAAALFGLFARLFEAPELGILEPAVAGVYDELLAIFEERAEQARDVEACKRFLNNLMRDLDPESFPEGRVAADLAELEAGVRGRLQEELIGRLEDIQLVDSAASLLPALETIGEVLDDLEKDSPVRLLALVKRGDAQEMYSSIVTNGYLWKQKRDAAIGSFQEAMASERDYVHRGQSQRAWAAYRCAVVAFTIAWEYDQGYQRTKGVDPRRAFDRKERDRYEEKGRDAVKFLEQNYSGNRDDGGRELLKDAQAFQKQKGF